MTVTKLRVDPDAWAKVDPPVKFAQTGDYYRFIVPGRTEAPQILCIDGDLQFTLDRSSSHKALYAYLTSGDRP